MLAGCQSFGSRLPAASPQPAPTPVASAPSATPNAGINGTWVPTDAAVKGVYVAQFRNGVFVSTSPKTNQPLAKGKYSITAENNIQLEFVGAATNTVVKAKCERPAPTTLYCVPTIGSPFTLQRTT